jgi:regulator of sigma E protease
VSYVLAGLALGLLILFHEFGHYLLARLTGMRVERFSIGFGPVLFAWRRGDTEFALSAVPLGGYVKIAGMAVEDDVEAGDARNYVNKPWWQRLMVIGAGPGANYLLSFLLGIGFLVTSHRAPNPDWARIGTVAAGSPAATAGLQPNDDILTVDGSPVHDFLSLHDAIVAAAKRHPKQPFPVTLTRGGETKSIPVQPRDSGDGYIIGITPAEKDIPPLRLDAAMARSGRLLWERTADEAHLIGRLLSRQASTASLSGPIGIISVTAQEARKGLGELVAIVFELSIAVGFINMMPIPGLDGGRFLFLVYEGISRRRMNQAVEARIHVVGLALLLVLIVFVSFGDIMHLVRHS